MDWIGNLITGMVGVAGVFGTVLAARHQTQSAAKAEARQWLWSHCSQLLALAYRVKSSVEDYEAYEQTQLDRPKRSTPEASGDMIDEAYRLAAACMMGGSKRLGDTALALATCTEQMTWDILLNGSSYDPRGFLMALLEFEEACRRFESAR